MRLLLLSLGLCLNFLATYAQDSQVKFGKINLEDLQMKSYPKDSSADAVALYDYGETDFHILGNDIYIRLKYHGRIKILKKSAYDNATVSLKYFRDSKNNSELISGIKGYTYNLENGQIKQESLTKDMIFNEKSSEGFSYQKFTLPNVKEGSVIEYTYEIKTPLSINQNPKTWTFQGEHPVVWSEYRITIPNTLYYRMILSGYLGLHVNENKPVDINLENLGNTGVAYRFVVRDAPAFRNEPYITTYSDYISRVNFELTQVNIPGTYIKNYSMSWDDLNKTLLGSDYLGKQLEKTNFLKDVAAGIKAGSADTTAQLEAAMKYIQQQVRWNGETSLYSKNIKKILEQREGDSGDINLLLVALLREMGYDAHPLILSTRQHGRVNRNFAMLKQFNALVAHLKIKQKDVLLDATDEFLKVGMLPIYCLNQTGWLVHPKAPRFVDIWPIEMDRELEKAELVIGEDGELTGKFTKSYGGYSGWSAKKKFKEEGQEKFVDGIKTGKPTWNITKAEFKNQVELNAGMDAIYELSINDYATKAGDMIYLKPMLSEGHTDNSFKAESRAFPVDFGHAIEEVFVGTYQVPAGFRVLEQPKPVTVNLPDNSGRFLYAVVSDEKQITVTSRLHLRKAVYQAEEYGALKKFYDQIIAKHNEQIVLKKSN